MVWCAVVWCCVGVVCNVVWLWCSVVGVVCLWRGVVWWCGCGVVWCSVCVCVYNYFNLIFCKMIFKLTIYINIHTKLTNQNRIV